MVNGKQTIPTWARRVSRFKIAQLYRRDAEGIRDDDLVNEVGYGLFARIESCLVVSAAQRGKVTCPDCGEIVKRGEMERVGRNDRLLRCGCGWNLQWQEYRRTFHNRHLGCAGMLRPCQEFAATFAEARTYGQKMIAIDTLLHRFHWELEGHAAQPGAAVVIGGKMSEIADFLDALAGVTPNPPPRSASRSPVTFSTDDRTARCRRLPIRRGEFPARGRRRRPAS